MARLRRFAPAIFLFLIPLIPLWRAVFLGEAIGPFNQIRQMAPWNGPAPDQPWDVLQADGVLQFYGWRDLVFRAWGQGEVPFWNPYQLCGTPLLANSQSGGLYPPHILAGLFHLPTALAMTLLAWLHLSWAGLGCYVLARSVGATRNGAAVAGACFSLSAFMLAWTALPSVISTCAWIPWVLSCVYSMFRRQTGRSFAGLAVSTAMMLMAGHLQFAAYGLMAAILILLLLTFSLKRPVIIPGAAVGALLLGACLAMPQLLPVFSYSRFSHRQNVPDEQGYQAYIASALKPFELPVLLNSKALGDPNVFADHGGTRLLVSSYWPPLIKRGANYAESALGPSLIVIFLLALVPYRRIGFKKLGPMLALALLSLLFALGTPLNRVFFFLLPGWSSTGSPARIGVLFVLGLSVVAGLGVRPNLSLRRSRLCWAAGLCLLGVIASEYAPLLAKSLIQEDLSPYFSNQRPALIAFIAVVSIVAFQILGRKVRWLVMPLSAIAVLAAQIGPCFVRTGKPLEQVVQESGRIAAVNERWDLLQAAPALLPPNTATILRLHDVAGYDSLLHRDTVALLHEIDGQDPAPQANGNMMFIKPSADLGRLSEAGVDEIWSMTPITALGTPFGQDRGYFRYRLATRGRAYTENGPAPIIHEGFGRLDIKAPGPGELTVKERNMEGWSARIDGKRASIPPGRWIRLALGRGGHSIELRYQAPGFVLGLWVAVLALAALLITSIQWKSLSWKRDSVQ